MLRAATVAAAAAFVAAVAASSPSSTIALAYAAAAAADVPTQLHIALAGDETGMRVTFKTNFTTTAPTCKYGTAPTALNATAVGAPGKGYMPGHGYHNTVLLSPLAPATTYFYACASGPNATAYSQTLSFVSAPGSTPGGPAKPASWLIFGDMGFESSAKRGPSLPVGGLQANWSADLSRVLMESLKDAGAIDGVWHVGDIGYADDAFGHVDSLLRFEYEDVYDAYMAWLQNVSGTMPYMVSPGNHESECHSPACILDLEGLGLHLNNFSAFNARWAMPSAESGGVENMWFSWNAGGVHFVSIDTSTDFPGAPEGKTGDSGFPLLPAGSFAPDGAYYAWLEADLAKAAADPAVRWIVAGGHRPFSDFNGSDTVLAPLFARYGVSFYFAGHGHSYARWGTDTWADGVVHIMVGGAGCDEMPYPADQHVAPASALFERSHQPHIGLPQRSEPGAAPITDAAAGCREWCSRPVVRQFFADHRDGTEEPCRYCAVGVSRDAPPIYASDKMALGVLKVTDAALTWQLLRAPDGLVLDEITVSRVEREAREARMEAAARA